MKILAVIFMISIIGCSGKPETKYLAGENLSSGQRILYNILDSFKTEYSSANSIGFRDSVIDIWQNKLHAFVRYNRIDSIRVHVDSVEVKNWKISTQFHCGKDIQFSSGITFNEKMSPNEDSLYQFMKGLKEGMDTVVNFHYMGWPRIGNPTDFSIPVFSIYTFPSLVKK
jgi:hypothetical protein